MTAHDSRRELGNRHLATVHRGAIFVAFVSGTLALIAMLVGSALQIGLALAVCAAGWIVVHLTEQFATAQQASFTRLHRRSAAIGYERPARFVARRQRLRYPARHFGPISAA
jgi:hypothetical protein